MNLIANPTSLPPLIKTHAKELERGAIGIQWASIRPKYTEVLRCEVQHLPELHFLLPDLSFAIFEIAIELRILERDRRLRRKHLQHRDAVRSENVWRQIVFKVENTDELGLVN